MCVRACVRNESKNILALSVITECFPLSLYTDQLSFIYISQSVHHTWLHQTFHPVCMCIWRVNLPSCWLEVSLGGRGGSSFLSCPAVSFRTVPTEPRTSTCRPVWRIFSSDSQRCVLDLQVFQDATVTFLVYDVLKRRAASVGGGWAACGGPAALRGGLGGHQ